LGRAFVALKRCRWQGGDAGALQQALVAQLLFSAPLKIIFDTRDFFIAIRGQDSNQLKQHHEISRVHHGSGGNLRAVRDGLGITGAEPL
jgi:hypothetical protein